MPEIPTIKIKFPHHPRGWAIINADDFDPEKHSVYRDKEPEPPFVEDGKIVIPDDWQEMDWEDQVVLALAIVGGKGPLVPSEGQTVQEKAHAIIMAQWSDETSNLGTDSGDQLSDEQLRAAIEAATGKKPHPNAKRETLVNRYNEINAGYAR